jgi:hypothetical protein
MKKEHTTYFLLKTRRLHQFEHPFTGNFFVGFREAMVIENLKANTEKINSLGYLGKYQFGIETLKSVGCEAVPLFE